jgi:hypothetical protein
VTFVCVYTESVSDINIQSYNGKIYLNSYIFNTFRSELKCFDHSSLNE